MPRSQNYGDNQSGGDQPGIGRLQKKWAFLGRRGAHDGNAFIKMLRAIVAASADQYDDLVGNAYPDHFVADDKSIDRLMPGRESQAHRT